MKSKFRILITLTICLVFFALLGSFVYAEKTNKWIKSPGTEQYPETDALILFDHIGYDFNKDSSVVLTEHGVIKLLTKSSFKKFHKINRSIIRPNQKIKVEIARIIKPNGEIINLDKKTQITTDFPFGEKMPLHKDVGIVNLDYSDAKVGDIIEFKFTNTNKKPIIPGQFWGLSFTMDEVPLLYTEFIAKVFKKDVKLYYYTPKTKDGKMKPKITRQNGAEVYTWKLKNRPYIKLEPASTPFRSNVSLIMVSTFPSWKVMSEDFYKAFEPTLVPGADVKKKTEEVIKGKKSDFDKIEAIANYVSSKKMMDISFNPDNFEFFKADEIIKHERMTGNDGQILFISMLKAAGINAYPALMSDQLHGIVYKEIASPYQFNRLVTALKVDGNWKYIDIMEPIDKKLEMQSRKQGRDILVLKSGGSNLAVTPIAPPSENLESIDVKAELSSDGSLGARMTLVEKGTKKAAWHSLMAMLKQPRQRSMIFGRLVQVIAADAKLLGADFVEKENDDSIQFDITFMSEQYPMISGKYWIIKAPMLPAPNKAPFLAQDAKDRKLPVVMGSLGMEKKTFSLKIPESFKVVSMPSKVDLQNSVGSLKLDCKAEGNVINYTFEFKMTALEIPPEKYGELKELYKKASDCSEEVILLEVPNKDEKSKISCK